MRLVLQRVRIFGPPSRIVRPRGPGAFSDGRTHRPPCVRPVTAHVSREFRRPIAGPARGRLQEQPALGRTELGRGRDCASQHEDDGRRERIDRRVPGFVREKRARIGQRTRIARDSASARTRRGRTFARAAPTDRRKRHDARRVGRRQRRARRGEGARGPPCADHERARKRAHLDGRARTSVERMGAGVHADATATATLHPRSQQPDPRARYRMMRFRPWNTFHERRCIIR